jgi:hypothetical protein
LQFFLHPPDKPDYQLLWIVSGGVRYSGMFAWPAQFAADASGKDVSDQKIWTAITFLTHTLTPSGAKNPRANSIVAKSRFMRHSRLGENHFVDARQERAIDMAIVAGPMAAPLVSDNT